jgi:hypothetical protein
MDKLTEHIQGFRIDEYTKKYFQNKADQEVRGLTEYIRMELQKIARSSIKIPDRKN